MNDPAIENTPTLESVQEQFEAWRLSRTKREPIPETLWEAAVQIMPGSPPDSRLPDFTTFLPGS